jgi:hypothetical protein
MLIVLELITESEDHDYCLPTTQKHFPLSSHAPGAFSQLLVMQAMHKSVSFSRPSNAHILPKYINIFFIPCLLISHCPPPSFYPVSLEQSSQNLNILLPNSQTLVMMN